ncbi:MAG TPA: leucyl aminopeptidase [Blastocatellia bacterium]|nr:leucyl aminopeptidase [Blastocatellia bacterium]
MQIVCSRATFEAADEDALIVPILEGESCRDGLLSIIDRRTEGLISSVFGSGEIESKRDRWVLLHTNGRIRARRLMLYGAGCTAADSRDLQRAAGAAVRILAQRGVKSAAIIVRSSGDSLAAACALTEGAILGQLNPGLYSSNGRKTEIETLSVVPESDTLADLTAAVEAGRVMAEAANFARNLGNEPGNVMTPTELASRSREMAEREGLSFKVLEKAEMQQLGMGALLAVARGSEEPPGFIVLSYEPEELRGTAELLALIGKGITFDSGGISIKAADKMDEMKFDMCGGAAVIGAMQAIARLRPKTRVLGLVPATENLPSGRAVKPGDVLRSLSGKTIEVVNTDAEGRLILADAITYAINNGATHIVDAATLTGACVVALGEIRAGVMGSDQKLIDDLIAAGAACGERLWQLPIDREYGELIRSEIADVKNTGNRTAGAITAAMFLKTFAGNVPWAHLDIAGTAWLERERADMAKGATGFGVRTFANLALARAATD